MSNLLLDLRKVMDDYEARYDLLPDEARTSAWFYRQILEALGAYDESRPVETHHSKSLMGISVVFDPEFPENEFHWMRDGEVIGKIIAKVGAEPECQ